MIGIQIDSYSIFFFNFKFLHFHTNDEFFCDVEMVHSYVVSYTDDIYRMFIKACIFFLEGGGVDAYDWFVVCVCVSVCVFCNKQASLLFVHSKF